LSFSHTYISLFACFIMVASRISAALAVLTASAQAEGSPSGEVLSLLQTQVHKHNASTMPYDDVDDQPNVDWPGYNFHEFQQSLCEKYGEKFGLQSVGARQKCSTKIIPSNVDAFNKDLAAFGGCASGYPFTFSWNKRVNTGHKDGLGRVDTFTSGDGPATEAVAESCRLAAEKDPHCAGANAYVVQKHFCTCFGGVIGVKPKDIGYYRWAGPYLTCALKSMKASENPQEQDNGSDGVKGELYTIKETTSLQGCSKGWYSLNGGGSSYDSGRPSGADFIRMGNANSYRRPADCAAQIYNLKAGGPSPSGNTNDPKCKDAIGVYMHAAGCEGIECPQKDCGCLLPTFKPADFQNSGPAAYGGAIASSMGSWICLIDDGDVTQGDVTLPVPKKSGKYSADGPSEEKPDLSPEEKAKCKANRTLLKAARTDMKDLKAQLKAMKSAMKDAKAKFKAIKADMENC